MSWNDYYRACEGYAHRAELRWQETRYIAAMIYNANAKTPKTPEQLVPLRLDKKKGKKASKVDVNRQKRLMEEAQQKLNSKNGKQ